jgi:hypothetical protein
MVSLVSSELPAQLTSGVGHPGFGVHVPHPVIDRRQEAAVLQQVLLTDQSDSDHAPVTTVDEVTEAIDAVTNSEHVVPNGTVAEVAHVSLGLIEPLVDGEVRLNETAELSDGRLGVQGAIRHCGGVPFVGGGWGLYPYRITSTR